VIVRREPNGRIELHQTRESSVGEGAVAGGTVGLLAGLLLGLPVGAAVAGVLAGGGLGARDTGVENSRLRELGERLEAGHALLCLLVQPAAVSEVSTLLEPFGGVPVEP